MPCVRARQSRRRSILRSVWFVGGLAALQILRGHQCGQGAVLSRLRCPALGAAVEQGTPGHCARGGLQTLQDEELGPASAAAARHRAVRRLLFPQRLLCWVARHCDRVPARAGKGAAISSTGGWSATARGAGAGRGRGSRKRCRETRTRRGTPGRRSPKRAQQSPGQRGGDAYGDCGSSRRRRDAGQERCRAERDRSEGHGAERRSDQERCPRASADRFRRFSAKSAATRSSSRHSYQADVGGRGDGRREQFSSEPRRAQFARGEIQQLWRGGSGTGSLQQQLRKGGRA